MASGKIKWFNPTKGYGFIENEAGGQDIFLNVFTLLLFFVVLFFTITSSFAHQPVLNTEEEMSQSNHMSSRTPRSLRLYIQP